MSDWNDKINGGDMILSIAQHQQGIKSLEITPQQSDYGIKILTASEAVAPKQVNFDFWGRLATGNHIKIALFFRYVDINNFYAVELHDWDTPQHVRLFLREAGSLTTEDDNNITITHNTWEHWKVMFCETANTVYAMIYKEVSGSFVLQTELSHNPAKFTDGGACGVGYVFSSLGWSSMHSYLDNMKVYYV